MDSSGVTQRDIMNYLSNDSETFREYETMMLRKIESKSFVIAMAKAIIRAGYIKSDVKSGRANRWGLPSDIVPVMAKVEPPAVKKSPSLLKLPNSGAKSKKNPMALPKATDLSKMTEGAGEAVAMDNVDKPEKKEDDLRTRVESWFARPEHAEVATTLQPNLSQKEEIMKEFGADKKKVESLFYRMRKKLKQQKEGGADTSSELEVAKTAIPGNVATDATPADQSKPAAPVNMELPTASAPPTGATAAASDDKITQLEHQNHVYSHALNEALQMGSPLKEATERAAAAAAAAVVERKS